MANVRLQITLPPEAVEKLDKLTKDTGLSKSAIITLAISSLHADQIASGKAIII